MCSLEGEGSCVPWYGTLCALVWDPTCLGMGPYMPWYGTGTTHLCALMWTQDQAWSLLLTSSDTALKAYFHHAFLSSLRGLPGLYFQNCLFRLYHSYVSMVSRALLNCTHMHAYAVINVQCTCMWRTTNLLFLHTN